MPKGPRPYESALVASSKSLHTQLLEARDSAKAEFRKAGIVLEQGAKSKAGGDNGFFLRRLGWEDLVDPEALPPDLKKTWDGLNGLLDRFENAPHHERYGSGSVLSTPVKHDPWGIEK